MEQRMGEIYRMGTVWQDQVTVLQHTMLILRALNQNNAKHQQPGPIPSKCRILQIISDTYKAPIYKISRRRTARGSREPGGRSNPLTDARGTSTKIIAMRPASARVTRTNSLQSALYACHSRNALQTSHRNDCDFHGK